MANSEIISPVYKAETAQENGIKLDTIAILLGNIAASQRAIANAQPEVSMDVDLNTVRPADRRQRRSPENLPARHPAGQHLHRQGRQNLQLPLGRRPAGRHRRGRNRQHRPGPYHADALRNSV